MADFELPIQLHKGRGAASQVRNRYEPAERSAFADGWQTWDDELSGDAPRIATTWHWEDAQSALVGNDSPDISFDYSVNPYRGCEHGCAYCYARPTHSYLGLSPGLDFERVIIAKRGLEAVLRHELGRPGYRPGMIVIGSATDAYQPIERELMLTRRLIEVLRDARHPFSLITKSASVERDLDLLVPMAQDGLVAVYVTITTLNADLARKLEPRAASPQRRLRVIQTLVDAGVPVGVSVAPQIPFINEDMEQVLQVASQAGAKSAFYSVLRLPWELNEVFQQWLSLHYPLRAGRVMSRIREMHAGRDYNSHFGTRMTGQGVWADLLRQRFSKACIRYGLNRARIELDFTRFRAGLAAGQGRLF